MSFAPRLVFAGTPEFSVAPLRALLDAGYQVAAVYTQPDRPAGRGRQLQASPVKALALSRGVPVLQPATLKGAEARDQLAALGADLLVVVAYGLILPQAILDTPRLGCINIHASLLPRWRGAAPIQRALLAGDEETGVCIMAMEAGLDSGPVLHRRVCPIAADDTGGSLHDRLMALGAEALLEVLPRFAAGAPAGQVQDAGLVTYAHKLDKGEARIAWSHPALDIERQVRAFDPWPVAETGFRGQTMRVWSARVVDQGVHGVPGRVVAVGDGGLDVATGAGLLRITRLQMPGKRVVAGGDFRHAHDLADVVLG